MEVSFPREELRLPVVGMWNPYGPRKNARLLIFGGERNWRKGKEGTPHKYFHLNWVPVKISYKRGKEMSGRSQRGTISTSHAVILFITSEFIVY